MKVKIKKLHPDAVVPTYAHGPEEDAGMDLRAIEDVLLSPNVPTVVKTGLSIELPPGFEAQIRPRSGLAAKQGITIPNSPGTIDPSYRGEVGVILMWSGHKPNAWLVPSSQSNFKHKKGEIVDVESYTEHYDDVSYGHRDSRTFKYVPRFKINKGDRIAQMVIARYEPIEWEDADDLTDSTRGEGGFGSSGLS